MLLPARNADAQITFGVQYYRLKSPFSSSMFYGGDFFAAERSEWDSLTLDEHRSDGEQARRMFERANARYEASLRAAAG